MAATVDRSITRTPKLGEVYNVRFVGTDSEQSGCRPAVIFQNNTGNIFSPNVIVFPMTSNLKRKDMPTHVVISAKDSGLRVDSMVICENPVSISKSKLGSYITTLSDRDMARIAAASLLATSALDLIDHDALHELKKKSSALNTVA